MINFAVCDPVLGDNGQLYVPKDLIPIYQNEILPLCDICTPNQFEAETLTGQKIRSHDDAWRATEWFHAKGVGTVVISSTNFASDNELIAFLSQQNGISAHFELKLNTELSFFLHGVQANQNQGTQYPFRSSAMVSFLLALVTYLRLYS